MKTSTIVTIVAIVIVVAGLAWWVSMPQSALHTAAPVPQGAATTSAAVPGDNLTLGQSGNAALGNYVVGYNGMTLYTYALDKDGVSNCTGACATNWPPYVVTSTDNLVAESPLAGTIGTLTRADGSTQVTYDGHPLYFYAADTQGGDTNGQGVGGIWYVVQP